MSDIFKAYDVRGIYPEEINKEISYKIGFGTAKFLQAKDPGKQLNIVIGEDCRLSSPAISGAVIDAITKAGINVYYIGACTTPLFYFSVSRLKADGGLMVTASHNPPQYGGLKIVGPDSRPIGQETGLNEIKKLAEEQINESEKAGTVTEKNLTADYVDLVIKRANINLSGLKKLNMVVDAGNGMTPLVLKPLFEKLGIDPAQLYFDVDCNFPNRSPNVLADRALDSLRDRVLKSKAHIGVAFDGDGDRVVFVDQKGERIDSGYILALIYNRRSGFLSRPKTAYDLRFSRSVEEALGSQGVRSRVGHSFIKNVMREGNLDLGGELSGHFFFKEMSYAESSILAMLIILDVVAGSGKPVSELIKPLKKYWHSGEINVELENKDQVASVLQKIKDKYTEGKIDELDGITIDLWDKYKFWFNVRPSNTEPVLRLVVEAERRDIMEEKVTEIKKMMRFTGLIV